MTVRAIRRTAARTPMAVLVAALLVQGCAADDAPSATGEGAAAAGANVDAGEDPAPDPLAPAGGGTPAPTDPGAYVTLAAYASDPSRFAGDDVVLFFTAPWCSSCKQTRESIESDLEGIPAGLVIVTVDYDTEDELKRAHGVTVQHTFVQVDGDGATIKKWTGSLTAEAIAEQTV